MAISKQQSMRPAEIELIDATNQHESTLQAHAQSLETLDKSLTAETTARDSADTALGTRIDSETQARTDADTALGTRIDNEVQARTDADTELGTRIDEEAQARTDADTALGTRIDNEAQARKSSDANLQGQIDALVAIGAEPNVIDSISVNGVAQTVTNKSVNVTVEEVVNGNDIAPANINATGAITGNSVGDANGTLQQVRESVSLDLTTMLTFNSGFSLRGGFAYRKNGVIYFDIGINCTTAPKAGVIFHPFTINSGYRPKAGGFGGGVNVYSRIQVEGIVTCNPVNSDTSYWISGSYLVE